MFKLRSLVLMIVIFCFSTNVLYGKIIEDKLEPALLEVKYKCKKVRDTLDIDNDFRIDYMKLQVGKSKSAFFSAELKYYDSLRYHNKEYDRFFFNNKEMRRKNARCSLLKVFKNYPEGKIRVHDHFDLCGWTIDEAWEKPIWSISDSTCNVLGYECVKAETDFRGRHWIAWFTFDIPLSDGPWKLCGLPGIILWAYDSKGHYSYEAIALNNEQIGNVEFFDYSYAERFTTTRQKGLTRKQKYIHEDIGYLIASSGMFGIKNDKVKKIDKIPHTNYDFEETDYPHE